ncbi:hypothetical protein C4D60_Mb05t02220 [Musa balbisiana]|uniref:Uncharacterized protein n=1 Tax=Musa balbisiana TaxID=52838 RepID=A0A4S8JT34_MUSBA|nr:hypothetical protein C4D60_Mb05t02220 [Musa balbisiana]
MGAGRADYHRLRFSGKDPRRWHHPWKFSSKLADFGEIDGCAGGGVDSRRIHSAQSGFQGERGWIRGDGKDWV